MQKNVASQKWIVFAFDRTDNTPKTGDAAQITAEISADGAAGGGNITDTNPTELEDGYYAFDITQGESNADLLTLLPESSTGNIQVIGVPGSIYTTPPAFPALTAAAITDDWETQSQADPTGFHVNIQEWIGTAVTLGNSLPDVNVDSIDDTAIAGIATAGILHVLDDAGATVATEAKQDTAQTELDKIGTIPALDAAAQTIGAAIGKLADDNGGATFDAGEDSLNKIRDDRTLPAADYTVVGDTIARVTLVDTVTTNTDLVSADSVWDATGTDTSLSFETLLERAYQFFVNELKIVDLTGGATLRNFADDGDMATWTISDDDTNTERTAISWA